jgi:hypothetical protein
VLGDILESDCLAIAIHIDGETDKAAISSAAMTLKVTLRSTGKTRFFWLGLVELKSHGATGFLEAFEKAFDRFDRNRPQGTCWAIVQKLLAACITDGCSVNTGHKSGLWVRLRLIVGKHIICVWCICHKGNVVVKRLLLENTDLRQAKDMTKNACKFYNFSSRRTNDLKMHLLNVQPGQKLLKFPQCKEHRFVEFWVGQNNPVGYALGAELNHWHSLVHGDDRASSTAEERLKAGILLRYFSNPVTLQLWGLAYDLTREYNFFSLQFQSQSSWLGDVEINKKTFMATVSGMKNTYKVGGMEESIVAAVQTTGSEDAAGVQKSHIYGVPLTTARTTRATHGETGPRRTEVVSAFHVLMDEQISIEGDIAKWVVVLDMRG